jgi:CMP-N,N'-diacetyllegionaminic acid synthase
MNQGSETEMHRITFVAIIPARRGSKRLSEKNTMCIGGKPMIGWTIEAAKRSKYIRDVVVTTEDESIARTAQLFGAEIPFMRPMELAEDTSSAYSVLEHAVLELKRNKREYTYVILLQPTSPLRNQKHIDDAIELLQAKKADSVVSVSKLDFCPMWANIIGEDLSLENFLRPEVIGLRSQELPDYYRLNGAIYIIKTEELLAKKTVFINKNVFAYIMNQDSSVDIDTMDDFRYAEYLLNEREHRR